MALADIAGQASPFAGIPDTVSESFLTQSRRQLRPVYQIWHMMILIFLFSFFAILDIMPGTVPLHFFDQALKMSN